MQSDIGEIAFHRQSCRSKVRDYALTFREGCNNLCDRIEESYVLFSQLIQTFNQAYKARLIAQVEFLKVNGKSITFYFPSYPMEEVTDPHEFFTRHLIKITSDIDNFCHNGSNLILNAIVKVYITVSFI